MVTRLRPLALAVAGVLALVLAGLAWHTVTRGNERTVVPPVAEYRLLAAAPSRIGLIANTLDGGGLRRAELDLVRRSGARWVREEVRWNEIEPRPGMMRWEKIDGVMAQAARRRLRVLPLLIGTPPWVAAVEHRLPTDPGGFAAFVARVVGRYGTRGTFWRGRPAGARRLAPRVFEVWNEPFVPQFAGGQVSAARYARLFRAAAAAGRRANPDTRYLLAADTTYVTRGGHVRQWIPDLFAAVPELRRWVWGLAVHPYSGAESPRVYTPGASRFQFLRLREVRREWGGNPRVWVTELGWSTCPAGNDCVSEDRQARYIHDAFAMARAADLRVGAFFVYHLRDFRPADPHDREEWFGLRRPDGSAKPAWFAFRRIAAGSR
jgi:polysaccharide biosynthesis protein PslG